MPKPKYVTIKNGNLYGYCTEEALEAWTANGWTAVDDGSSESDEVSEQPEADEDEEEVLDLFADDYEDKE